MFRNSIRETEFSSDAANRIFENITGDSYRSDVSFLSTLRALLHPRMEGEENPSLTFTVSTVDYESGRSAERTVSNICDYIACFNQPNIFSLVSIPERGESEKECFSKIESAFTDVNTDWHRVERITALYKKAFDVLCYINPEKRSTVLFVETLDIRKFHYLQCCIPGALPWYFESNKVNEEEFALIDSLRKHEPDEYIASIKQLATHYDFRAASIKALLKGFETKFEEIERASLSDEIVRIGERIEECLRAIQQFNVEKTEKSIKLLGLDAKIKEDGDSSEIMDYFLCNDSLYLSGVGDRDFWFVVKSKLTYYDSDAVKTYLENKNSIIYRSDTFRNVSSEDMAKLIKAIFVDETLSVNMCAAFKIDLYGSFTTLSGHANGPEFSNCMPNPHIENYGCMGDYVRIINELLDKRDYVLAIEQCIASTQSVNWYDSTVISAFMRNLYNDDKKYIVLPDGKEVSPKEAVEWLNEKEEA